MRVVMGEDEALMRRGLLLVLEQAGFEVVGVVGDADALVRSVRSHLPDLVITDIRMPPSNSDDGLRAALAIRAEHPGMPVLVLSHHVQREYALELLAGNPGGVGYLLKQRIADIEEFCSAMARVAAGGTAIDPAVVEMLVDRARREDAAIGRLTPRQHEVLALVAEGCSNAVIAERLSISEKAVVQHCAHIYTNFDLAAGDGHRRVLAVIRYLSR